MTPWEQRFQSLWHTFMLTAPGLPNAETLHRFTPSTDSKLEHPALAVVCELKESKHPSILRMDLHHRLQIERQLTPVATAEEWLQAIRDRMVDTDAFVDHIMTLTLEQRTGWQIHRVIQPTDVSIKDDPAKQIRQWEISVHMIVQIGW